MSTDQTSSIGPAFSPRILQLSQSHSKSSSNGRLLSFHLDLLRGRTRRRTRCAVHHGGGWHRSARGRRLTRVKRPEGRLRLTILTHIRSCRPGARSLVWRSEQSRDGKRRAPLGRRREPQSIPLPWLHGIIEILGLAWWRRNCRARPGLLSGIVHHSLVRSSLTVVETVCRLAWRVGRIRRRVVLERRLGMRCDTWRVRRGRRNRSRRVLVTGRVIWRLRWVAVGTTRRPRRRRPIMSAVSRIGVALWARRGRVHGRIVRRVRRMGRR